MTGSYVFVMSKAQGLDIITNTSPLILTGNTIMTVANVNYIQRNDIVLEDNAQLIVQSGAIFEHRHDYSFEHTLEAYDNSKVIVRNAEIQSSNWLNWGFHNSSKFILNTVEQSQSSIWHTFADTSSGSIQYARFNGTIFGSASLDIQHSPSTFVEFVYPTGSTVDDSLPTGSTVSDLSVPGIDDTGISFNFRMRDSIPANWGITVGAQSDITIRDTDGLTTTIVVTDPWHDETVDLSGLGPYYYADETWNVIDTTLRLVNVTANPWSPIAGGTNNTLILRNSILADNAFSWGNANIQIINSTGSFVRAGNHVSMTVSGSYISGDATATDSGTLTILNSHIHGQVVAEEDGTVHMTNATVDGTISKTESGTITAQCTVSTCHLNKYWIGPSGGSFRNNAYWSLESGGTNDTTAPSSSDNAIFDDGANTSVVMTGSIRVNNIHMTSDYTQQVNASGSTVTIAEDLEISGGTFVAPTTLSIGGDFFHNNGSFTANGGSVTGSGAGVTHVLSGSTTFYNLSFTASGQLSIHPATTLTITNALHLGDHASASSRLLLRSSTSGTQWKINAQGSRTLSYLDIKDSNNIHATPMNCASGCVDSGGNANWVTSSSGTTKYWIGGENGSFTSDANWSTTSGGGNNTTAPGVNDVAVFDGSYNTNCTLSSTVDVSGIVIQSGYTQTVTQSNGTTLTLSGGGLTMYGGRFSAGDSLIINGPLNLYSTSATTNFFANAATITLNGNWTVQGSNSYNLFPFNYGTSTVILAGGDSTYNFKTLVAFNNLTVDTNTGAVKTFTGGSVVTLNNKLNSTLRLKNGTINQGLPSFAIFNGGNLSVEPGFDGGNATVVLQGADVRPVHLSGGSVLPTMTLASTGVTVYGPSSGVATFSGGFAMQNGTFTESSGEVDFGGSFSMTNGTFNASGTTVFSSSFAISGTSTFNAGSASLRMQGAVTVSSPAIFSAGTSTVTLDGTSQTINGTITFYNLTKTSRDGSTLSFSAGNTQTITGTLTLSGSTTSPLLLRSTTTGTQWKMDAQGSRVVRALNVKDARSLHATAMYCASSCTNAGNNNMWQFPSTTTLTSSLNPSGYGSGVILTATVSPSSATGTITFKDSATTIGTASIGHGSGSLTISSLSVGSHTLTAIYEGSPSLSESTSNTINQTITKGQPSVILTSNSNPSVQSGSVQFSAVLTPSDGTGTITFKRDATTIGSASVGRGSGSFTTNSLPLGSHSISAIYSGNASYLSATSSTLTQVVSNNITSTTTTLISGSNPATFGNSVLFTVTVSPSNASGSVSIQDGTTTIGTATISHGSGTFIASSLGAGTHAMTAVFTGGGYAGSTSNAISQVIARAGTTTYLSSSNTTATFDDIVTFTITVVPSSATGTIILKKDGTTIGSVLLSHGSGTIAIDDLETGSHNMTAQYEGNGQYDESDSATLLQTIELMGTSLTVVTSPNPATAGNTVTISVTINPSAAMGSVSLYNNITLINTITLSNGSGNTTYAFTAGSHVVTASYAGNDRYDASTGQVTHVVLPPSSGTSSSQSGGGGGGGGGGVGTTANSTKANAIEATFPEIDLHEAPEGRVSGLGTVFHDVASTAWFASYVAFLSDAQIVSGYKDTQGNSLGLYRPNQNVTYAEAAKMILKIAGEDVSISNGKNISAKKQWSEHYIARMEEKKISVFKNPKLDVNGAISRGTLLQVLMEVFHKQGTVAHASYVDVPKKSRFYKAIMQATADGIVSGDDAKKTFRPNDPVNRAEIAKIMYLVIKKYSAQQ